VNAYNRRVSPPLISIESLRDGPDRVLSSARTANSRSILFVRRPSGAVALVTVEGNDPSAGEITRIVGVATLRDGGLEELDRACFAAKRAIEVGK
jgi:hypothetical protein